MTPSNYSIFQGDLLESDCDLIVHQCNCVSREAKGLADAMFKKFPYADRYTDRTHTSDPGTAEVNGDPHEGKRWVGNLYAQFFPGAPSMPYDTYEQRKQWFIDALKMLKDIVLAYGITSVGFPYGIGCGLAKGKWEEYEEMIKEFARVLPHVDVVVYLCN